MEGDSWLYHFSRHWMLDRVPTACRAKERGSVSVG